MEIGDAVKADCKVEKIDSFYTVLKRVEMLTVNVEERTTSPTRLDSFDTGEAAQFQAMAHKLELFELKDHHQPDLLLPAGHGHYRLFRPRRHRPRPLHEPARRQRKCG